MTPVLAVEGRSPDGKSVRLRGMTTPVGDGDHYVIGGCTDDQRFDIGVIRFDHTTKPFTVKLQPHPQPTQLTVN
ncbi:MAG TPA: hypothetical protein VK338_02315 [Candidatus Nitrosocosmicus sp.]|nr:hypothetical protein [Candidatus Nitrosocosmicus sp.]